MIALPEEEFDRLLKMQSDLHELACLLLDQEETESGKAVPCNKLKIHCSKCIDRVKLERFLKDLNLVQK